MEQERLWILLGRKLAGEATEEELKELELLLLAYGEDASAMEIIERMWASRGRRSAAEKDNALLDRIDVSAFPVRRGRRIRAWTLSGIAACIAGLVYWGVVQTHKGDDKKEETMNVIYTRRKSHSNLQFPDGTTVVLNENSRISYNADFGKTRREITLEGEAYFNVAGNAGIPLIIHARDVDIKVLGTVLNVKAYPSDKNVETSLIRGKVEVCLRKDAQRRILLKPNEKVTLGEERDTVTSDPLPGDNPAPAVVKRTETPQALKVEKSSRLIPEIAWIYRKLVFNQEPFASVAEKIERWYDVKIYFEDDELKKEVFSGSFEKESLEQALNALQYSYPFDFTIKKKEVFIRRK